MKRGLLGREKGQMAYQEICMTWWLRKIQSGAVSVGHRYWCLSVLASYGIKCDIPEDEVLTDALELLPMFDNISDDEHNHFTKRECTGRNEYVPRKLCHIQQSRGGACQRYIRTAEQAERKKARATYQNYECYSRD